MKEKKTLRWARTDFGKMMIERESTDGFLRDYIEAQDAIGAYRHGCRIAQVKQKAIDIDKACDAYCHHCPNYADDAIGLQGCSGGGCDVLRDFRKAMED